MILVFSKDKRRKDLEEGTKTQPVVMEIFNNFSESYESVHQKDYAGFIAKPMNKQPDNKNMF